MIKIKKFISWFFLLISFLLLIYIYYKSEIVWQNSNLDYYQKYYVISFILILLSIISFFINDEIKINTLIIIISTVFSSYILEFYIDYYPQGSFSKKSIKSYKEKTGKNFDLRSKFEIYKDLKKRFPNITVVTPPNDYLKADNFDFFHLAGISNAKTIFCNESGYFSTYQSDKYGFNNPKKEWLKKDVEFILVGDSFTHGACVNRPNDISGNIRLIKKNDTAVLNLGYAGHGPIMQYATIKEYSKDLNPKNVLWLYYEGNDLADLENQLENSFLLKYFNDNTFYQNLTSKQKTLDELLKKRINKQIKEIIDRRFSQFIKLYSLRNLLKMNNEPKVKSSVRLKPFNEFKKILNQANELTKKNGSKLYFIYLPELARYKNLEYDNFYYNKIIKIVDNLGIPMIDIHKNVFINQDKPLVLFPFGNQGHYNEIGYKLVAKNIYEFVNSK